MLLVVGYSPQNKPYFFLAWGMGEASHYTGLIVEEHGLQHNARSGDRGCNVSLR